MAVAFSNYYNQSQYHNLFDNQSIDMIDPDFWRKYMSQQQQTFGSYGNTTTYVDNNFSTKIGFEEPKDILSKLRRETKEFCKNVRLK